MKQLHTTTVAIFIANILFAQHPGDLDSTFGVNGTVITDFGGSHFEQITSLSLQADGKIIAAGALPGSFDQDFAMARYNTDGSLDSTFGIGGKVGTDSAGLGGIGAAIPLPNGKIFVLGWDAGSVYDFALALYNSDGTLDQSFGSGGKVTTDIDNSFEYTVSMVRQSDGKIVALGNVDFASRDFALVRYNGTGILDDNFGTGGKVTTDFDGEYDESTALALQPDGKIVVAGYAENNGTVSYDFELARYNADGTPDNGFGIGGKLTTDFDFNNDLAYSVAIQADGKIIVAGYTSDGNNSDFAIARFNTDGTLDNSFSGDGKLTTEFGSGEAAFGVAIQPDGKILLAGGSGNTCAVARYHTDGMLDNTFGIGGLLTISSFYVAKAMMILPDGKILLGGYKSDSGNLDFAFARILSEGMNVGIVEFSQSPDNILIYPNPLTQTATLKYTLQQDETLSIRLLDLQGKTIKTFLENTKQEAGQHQQAITLPESLPSGSYLIVIESAKGKMGVKVVK